MRRCLFFGLLWGALLGAAYAANSLDFFGLHESKEKKESIIPETQRDINALIKTIENKQKREQLVKALKALSVFANLKKSEPTFTVNLIKKFTTTLEKAAELAVTAVIAVVNFPVDLFWGVTQLANPDIRNTFFEFLIDALIVLGGAAFAEVSFFYLLQRVANFTQLILSSWLVRLSWVLLPITCFTLIAFILLQVLAPPTTSPTLKKVLVGILGVRLLWATSYILLLPRHQELRVIPLKDETAIGLHSWFLTIGQIMVIGILLTSVLSFLSLPATVLEVWLRLYGFFLTVLLIGLLNNYHEAVSSWLRPEKQAPRDYSRFVIGLLSLFSRLWYFLVLAMILGSYFCWAIGAFDYLLYITQASFLTVLVVCLTIYSSRTLYSFSRRWFSLLSRRAIASENPRNLWNNIIQSTYSFLPFIQVLLYVLALLAVFWCWGIDLLEIINNGAARETFMTVASILIIIWVTRIVWGTIDIVVEYQMKPIELKEHTLEPSILVKTLGPIIRTVLHVATLVVALVMILGQLHLNVLPLIYGVSILGLALSFGAQDLAKDLINGVLILLEGNVAVGEFVSIAENSGVVEAITPRSIFIRDSNGYLQSIPFSKVNNIVNKSRNFTSFNIRVHVDHITPWHKAYQALEETAQRMYGHPRFGSMIQEPLKILGISQELEHGYTVVASIKIDPDPRNLFLYEFYRQWKETAANCDIKMPIQRHQVELLSA